MEALDREEYRKSYFCQKSRQDVPLSEPRCVNPTGYCKWRTACPIRALEKEHGRDRD